MLTAQERLWLHELDRRLQVMGCRVNAVLRPPQEHPARPMETQWREKQAITEARAFGDWMTQTNPFTETTPHGRQGK